MSMHKFYIRMLILSLVLGPLAWVMFTDDGQRYSDIFMLELGDSESINLNFANLSSRVDEATLQQQFPQVAFKCVDQVSAFGHRQCSSALASINGAPAQYIKVFFVQDHLSAVKVGYQPSYHQYVYNAILTSFGEGEAGPEQGMRRWNTGSGMLYAPPQELTLDKEAALLWLVSGN